MHIENIRKKHTITICPNNWTNNEMKGEYVILAFTNKQQDKIILSIRKKITSSQIIIKTKNNIPMLIKPQQLLLLLLFICIGAKAQERTILLQGYVRDAFTNGGIKNVSVILMDEDSTIIDKQTVKYIDEDKTYMESYYSFNIPASPKKYIVKAEQSGYESAFSNYNVKYIARNQSFQVPTIYMKRKSKLQQVNELDEVVVKATKVKIVFKGDTVVYNADAFNLPNGSMLDELIRQMPSVTLNSAGEIFKDGKKVDNLLLQGEKFMKGEKNQKILLRNLPAYTVKNIKFYNRTNEKNQYLGYNNEKKEFVMDVQLKKEYATGYIVNAEAGLATHKRYNTKLFGLRYTPLSRLSFFSSANNINQDLRPGSDGEWDAYKAGDGVLSFKIAGLDWFLKNTDKSVSNEFYVKTLWRDGNYDAKTITTTFLPTHNNYTTSTLHTNGKETSITAQNDFIVSKSFYLYASTFFEYWKTSGTLNSKLATFQANPFNSVKNTEDLLNDVFNKNDSTIKKQLVNSNKQDSDNRFYRYGIWQTLEVSKKLPWGDNISLEAEASYVKERKKNFNGYQLQFMQTNTNETEHQYMNEPSHHYNIAAKLAYNIHLLNNWNFNASYGYQQNYQYDSFNRYRLDKLSGWTNSRHRLTDLPSTRDSLLLAMDLNNSYQTWNRFHVHSGTMRIFYDKEGRKGTTRIDFLLPLAYKYNCMNYLRSDIDTLVSRRDWLFTPTISYSFRGANGKNWQLAYNMEVTTPDLKQTIRVTDTSKPLSVYMGNGDLQNTTTHSFSASYGNIIQKLKGQYYLSANFKLFHQAVGNAMSYNTTTGIYTYQPRNINGNWIAEFNNGFSVCLDKRRIWTLENNMSLKLNNNVDFVTLNSIQSYGISKVRNFYFTDGIKLTVQKNSLRIAFIGNIDIHNSKSLNSYFKTFSVCDFYYGLAGNYTLPYDIQFATDLKMYGRRRYSDQSSNNNCLVWNASLVKTFMHDRLNISITGYDILQNISSHTYIVNGQGREETFYNNIPSYVMLTIGYRISKKP